MKEKASKSIMSVLVIFLVIFNFLIFITAITSVDWIGFNKLTAKSSSGTGEVKFCLNPPVTMESIASQCNTTLYLHTNESYFCNLTYEQMTSDIDRVLFSRYFNTIPQPYSITFDGKIDLTTQRDSWGVNHSNITHLSFVVLTEIDDTCEGDNRISYYPYDFTIIFQNTPPEYHTKIENITLQKRSSLFAFYLEDYFSDIDDNILEYSVLLTYNADLINVEVNPENGQTIITSYDNCGTDQLTFRAQETDSTELLDALTNPSIYLSVPCESNSGTDDSGTTGISGSSGSGGGGGSGGSGALRTCVEDWVCGGWSDCYAPIERYPDYPKGYKKKNCYDQNACANETEINLMEECIYTVPPGCYPEWECTEWTPCRKDGTQERLCVDNNKCLEEDQKRYKIPPSTKLCIYLESCNDGIRNNNELAVDCGGPCEPCTTIHLPSTIDNASKILTLVIGVLAGIIVIIIVIFQIFKKQIKKLISQFIWWIVKKAARQIYLIGSSKNKILNELKTYENKLIKIINNQSQLQPQDYEKLESELYSLFRLTFSEMLEINFESSKEVFVKKIRELNTTDEFRKIILGVAIRMLKLESNGRIKMVSQLDEIIVDFNTLKTLIFSISDKVNKKDYKKVELKIKPDNKLSNILINLNKAYNNIQNNQLNDAKKYYLSIIELYESLEEVEKAKVYDLTTELFNLLTYVNSHVN